MSAAAASDVKGGAAAGPAKPPPETRQFLSGVRDPELISQRRRNLLGRIVGDVSAAVTGPAATATTEGRRRGGGAAIIEVVGETTSAAVDDTDEAVTYESSEPFVDGADDASDDDAQPPPLSGLSTMTTTAPRAVPSGEAVARGGIPEDASADTADATPSRGGLKEDPPSLMEEMMAEASRARSKRAVRSTEARRKGAETASFGMKKGFLNGGSRRERKTTKKMKDPMGPRSSSSDDPVASVLREKKDRGGQKGNGGFCKGFLDRPRSKPPQRRGAENGGRSKIDSTEVSVFSVIRSAGVVY